MPLASEALYNFLHARKTPANADLVDRWSTAMETQVNVIAGDGEPVAGKKSTWTNGSDTWHSIRIPRNAATEPIWEDYKIGYPFDLYAEGIGMTGWDWQARRSRHFGYDFDALTGHAQGIGIDDDQLEKVKRAACALPYVEVRRSTGGGGVHLYVYIDDAGVPTDNHTEHAALARCILGMMSAEVGFDFASAIDACGHVMWIWHRKMTAENRGLAIIKPATKRLSEADLPKNWRDHIEVVKGRRSKIRVNQIAEDDQDPFETLASSRKIIPLDDSHKAQIEALMRSGATTLWVADHHLLQTHTTALRSLLEEEGKALNLVGVFTTISEGRDPGTPNCFLFPLPNGAWRVYRFSPGIAEADTWTQDGQGWTTCYFNRYPDLETACTLFGGVEREQGGFVFSSPNAATEAARSLGQDIELPDDTGERKVTLKAHKDGRLVVEIERRHDEEAIEGWEDKKGRYVKIFKVNVKTDPKEDDELDFNEFDKILRALKTTAAEHSGWMIREEGKEWIRHPASNVKMLLQSLDYPKGEAEAIMGAAIGRSWKLVNLPFREEYPGGRQWNMDAAQFRFKPAEVADDDVPYHPHWDLIFEHIGHQLTPMLRELPWAASANIRTGADYLRAWVACAFRDPFQPTPYLFFFGPENSGKSIFHEALQLLVTKGVVQAKRPLEGRDGFNGELSGAIICAVEEVDISKCPGARERLKAWVTGRTISIRKLRQDSFEQPNATHWVHTANSLENCPIFPGDTRITAVYVADLLDEQRIAKPKMEACLEQEAPHFLYTLMHMELPPMIDRLRLPVVTTASKLSAEEANQTELEQFIAECCEKTPDEHTPFGDFYDRFQQWLPANEKHAWSKKRVSKELPVRHSRIVGYANQKFVSHLTLLPAKEGARR
jgi:hypothetical protein